MKSFLAKEVDGVREFFENELLRCILAIFSTYYRGKRSERGGS